MDFLEKLTSVLDKPEWYGDITLFPMKYTPSYQNVEFTAGQTGTLQKQMFSTESLTTYYPVLYDGCAYLVSVETTTAPIELCGMDGYKNSTVILRKCARLYSNKEMMAEGVILDEETLGVVKKFKKEHGFWIQEKPCWTTIKHCEIERGQTYFEKYGLYQMTKDGKRHAMLYNHGGRYGKMVKKVAGVIRPIIRLHPDTYVKLELGAEGLELKLKLE